MKRWKVSSNTQEFLQSTTIRPGRFGGWMATNSGTADAVVDGYVLSPGDTIDYTCLDKDVLWDSPIAIDLRATGAKVRLTRLQYREVEVK